MYRIELTPRARREIDAMPSEAFPSIDVAIRDLADEPRPRGAIKLRGPIYRIRAGRWRIIYAVFDRDRLVIVGKVARRTENTYDELDRLF